MGKVKIAFIGAGNILKAHLEQGLKDYADVEIVGWCDPNEKAAQNLKQFCEGQGAIHTDADTMIVETKPDALFIMLPPFAHGKAEEAAIKHKIPFFVEKPVGIDLDLANKIAEGVDKAGLLTSVGYMTRYRASVNKVKDILKTQKPVLLFGGWALGIQNGGDNWWVRKHLSGGQFLEQATHATDLSRYLFGDVKSVYAVAQKGVYDKRPDYFTMDDSMMVQLQFKNGSLGNIFCSVCAHQGGGVQMQVFGTDMRASFTGDQCHAVIELPDNKKIEMISNEKPFTLEDRVFLDAVISGKPTGILSDYADGVKSLAIAIAANKSAETGQPIEV